MATWLRMGQAMARLNVTRKTLRRYCVEGLVTAEKLPGGHWRIEEASLEGLLGGAGFRQKVLAHVGRLRL